MKRILSTVVLFLLLMLTVVALTQIDNDSTSALNHNQAVGNAIN